MNKTPIEEFFDLLDLALNNYVFDQFGIISAMLQPTFSKMLVLFFILYGLAVYRGVVEHTYRHFIFNIFKIGIIYGLIFNIQHYGMIVDFFVKTPDQFAAVIANINADSISAALGENYSNAIGAAAVAYDADGWFMPFVVGTIILVSSSVVVLYATFLLGMSKIGLTIMLALGPIPIALLLFKGTKSIFQSWLQQCITLVLYTVLTIMVLTFSSEIFKIAVDKVVALGDDLATFGHAVPIFLASFTIFLILKQVPTIASAMGGGAQITTLGAEGAIGSAISSGANGAGSFAWKKMKQYNRKRKIKKAKNKAENKIST